MSASNVCPACGAVNEPANVFCIHCGTQLTAAGAGAPTAPPTGVPSTSPPAYPGVSPPYPYYPGPPRRAANFSSILSGMFDVWTKNFSNFFFVYLVLGLVTGSLGALLSFAAFGTFEPGGRFVPGSPPQGAPTIDVGPLILYAIASVVVSAMLQSIVMGGMTEYAVRRYRGESMALRQAIQRGIERFLSILGATILLTLMIFGLILVPLLLLLPLAGVVGSGDPGGALAVACGLIAALIVGAGIALYVYIAMVLYAPAIMMENAGAVEGLSRSWKMTKGYFWSLLGAIIIAVLLAAVIGAAILLPAALVGNPIVSVLASSLVGAIVGPWLVILAAVAYDLIVRQPTSLFAGAPPSMPGPTGAPPPSGP